MNVVFAVSEIDGLVKTGGLADVARALPLALRKLGQEPRVILPYYRQIEKQLPIQDASRSFAFTLYTGKEYSVKVHEFKHLGLTVYAVDCRELFDRDGVYGDGYHAYQDNGQRFTVFCIAVLEFFHQFASHLKFDPDIFHCNDWHTALIPVFMKQSPHWQNKRSLLTIHNGAFQGIFELSAVPSLLHKLGEQQPFYEKDLVNFLKLGIIHADHVNAVSPNYARELLTELGSHHLFDLFNHHQNKVTGILNGCDYSDWDPLDNNYLVHKYNAESLIDKVANKQYLQAQLNVSVDQSMPVFVMVSRLTEQKGLAYLLPALKELVQHRLQFFIAGTGDPIYVDQLEFLAQKYPDKIHFHHGYSEQLVHQYMAAADYFLMPSQFEPCGLTQMYALAYGTLPLVREVGGLKDTVIDISQTASTGVVFSEPCSDHLVNAVRRALLYYIEYPEKFRQTQENAMATKFLWQDSAEQYLNVYKNLIAR